MPRLLPLALSSLAAAAAAQSTLVLPANAATTAGNASNAFPWGWTAANYGGLRHLGAYDAANFTTQSVTFPVLITRLRWRMNDTTSSHTGGTFAQATVALSTAAVDYSAVTTNFASNHGPDYTLCYSGPVTHAAATGNGTGVPGPFTVDVPLTTPFSYDPGLGDLLIDVDYPGGANFQGGTLPAMDVQTTGSMASRVWGSTNYPLANGVWLDHGIVVEVTYQPVGPNVALSTPYGDGCYEQFASFYEVFPANSFDLSNQAIELVAAGAGYVVLPSAPNWNAPTAAATVLPLGNDAVSAAQSLGFTLPYPGGSTAAVHVSSNGFAWAQPSTDTGCCNGSAAQLLSQGARWCPLWADLNPAAGGTVYFEQDPANSAAYVTFVNVPEAGTSSSNTFQIAFFATGSVQYRFQQCAIGSHVTLTGWSPGGGALDPRSDDLSASLPIVTQPDAVPLGINAAARPIVNTAVPLLVAGIPAGSPLGAFVGGTSYFDPGLPLASLGMAGCSQYVSLEVSTAFVPVSGGGSFNFMVPNDPGLSGTHVYMQAAVLAAGVNALGVLTSNGVDLRVGTQ
ncbi:MAG: hypothetical protein KDC98_18350 [Planctomycetes bacterium]|nr:hypothetical protein [Planctomycetota bacterium]